MLCQNKMMPYIFWIFFGYLSNFCSLDVASLLSWRFSSEHIFPLFGLSPKMFLEINILVKGRAHLLLIVGEEGQLCDPWAWMSSSSWPSTRPLASSSCGGSELPRPRLCLLSPATLDLLTPRWPLRSLVNKLDWLDLDFWYRLLWFWWRSWDTWSELWLLSRD